MLKCNIVRQLMPNYMDGLLDEETKKDIEEHITTCIDCDALMKNMQKEIIDSSIQNITETKEIKYLKKFRKQIAVAVFVVTLFLFLLFGVILKVFYWGSPIYTSDMASKAYSAINDDELLFLLDFELLNGKTLIMDTKYLEGADGGIIGVILTPRAVANNPLDDTGPNYQYGYHLSSGRDFRITIRYADDKVVYDMRDWIE